MSDRKRTVLICASVPAVILFVVICLLAPLKIDLLCKPTKVEINVQQLHRSTIKPDVVLLGSSYVFWPICHMISTPEPDMEIAFKPDALNSPTLVDRLKIYNLSYAYQIISDEFIWVDQFLTGKNQPACIVLGCAPRDLQCSDYRSPVLTDNFITTTKFENVPEYVSMINPPFEDLTTSMFSKVVPLYHKRACLKARTAETVNSIFSSIGFAPKETKSPHPNIWTQPKSEIWNASLREYKYHYSCISSTREQLQFSFLERLLRRCKERNIKALIVNMPIRIENLNLLPNGYYDQYCQQLQRKTQDNQGDFIDLNKDPSFEKSDFDDTIHLNAAGGRKLFSAIFSYVHEHKLVASP